MDERLIGTRFDALDQKEKGALMKEIAKRFGMSYKGLLHFSGRRRKEITTGIFEKERAQFIFIPGDTVTMGWAGFSEGLTAGSIEELREVFEEMEFKGTYEEFLAPMLTPQRTAEIMPMLAERDPRGLYGDKVPVDDPRVRPEWREALTRAICGRETPTAFTILDKVRFTRTGDIWQAEIYSGVTYVELLEDLAAEGYSLPNADEWAYLCGGGCPTLFPWGDGITPGLRLRHFDDSDGDTPYDLEQPNFFGIKIAFDPYKSELIHADPPMYCGGDGGGNICGGLGKFLGYLPCSPYYKPQPVEEPIDGKSYFFRRIIRIE